MIHDFDSDNMSDELGADDPFVDAEQSQAQADQSPGQETHDYVRPAVIYCMAQPELTRLTRGFSHPRQQIIRLHFHDNLLGLANQDFGAASPSSINAFLNELSEQFEALLSDNNESLEGQQLALEELLQRSEAALLGLGLDPDEATQISKQLIETANSQVETTGADADLDIDDVDQLQEAIRLKNACQFQQALEIETRLLAKIEAQHGRKHEKTLDVLNNIGVTYRELGQVFEARSIEEECLHAKIELFGDDHSETMVTRLNLALTYKDLGLLAEAYQLEERVFQHRHSTNGANHPETLNIMGNMVTTLHDMGEFAKARAYAEHILEIQRQELGPNHRDTLGTKEGLALILKDMGEVEEALELQTSIRKTLEEHHPNAKRAILRVLGNAASCYTALGDFEKCVEIEEQVVVERCELLGENHLESLIAKGNLAISLRVLKQFARALELQEQVFAARRATFGISHAETLLAGFQVASTKRSMKRYSEANTDLLALVSELDKNNFSETTVAWQIYHELSLVHQSLCDFKTALYFEQLAFQNSEAKLGPISDEAVECLESLGYLNAVLSRFDTTTEILESVFERKKSLEAQQYDLISTLGSLAINASEIGHWKIAKAWLAGAKEVLLSLEQAGQLDQKLEEHSIAERSGDEYLTHVRLNFALSSADVHFQARQWNQVKDILLSNWTVIEDSEFSEDYLVYLLNQLSAAHLSLGELRQAEERVVQSLELVNQHLPANHADAIKAVYLHAKIQHCLSFEATQLVEMQKAIRKLQSQFDEEHLEVLKLKSDFLNHQQLLNLEKDSTLTHELNLAVESNEQLANWFRHWQTDCDWD